LRCDLFVGAHRALQSGINAMTSGSGKKTVPAGGCFQIEGSIHQSLSTFVVIAVNPPRTTLARIRSREPVASSKLGSSEKLFKTTLEHKNRSEKHTSLECRSKHSYVQIQIATYLETHFIDPNRNKMKRLGTVVT
jgi:hypothetical protein